MSMSVDRVLKAKVDTGNFNLLCKVLASNTFSNEEGETIVKAFESLLEMANGDTNCTALQMMEKQDKLRLSIYKESRLSTLSEVRRIVEEYKKYVELLGEELDELVSIAAAHGWKSSRYDKGVVCRENIKRLLSELEANG